MAGKRQHILPRFLLKGFASRVQGKEIYTRVYRKGGASFEVNIDNAGVERYFYGKEGEVSVDEEITNIEGKYAVLIEKLRHQDNQTEVIEVHELEVAELIAHVCARTKNFRESARHSIKYSLDELFKYLLNHNNLKKLLLNRCETDLKNYPISELQKELLFQQVLSTLPNLIDSQESRLKELYQDLSSSIEDAFPELIKESHISALLDNPIPEPRVDKYRQLNWFIYSYSHPLILGDNGCLFEVSSSKTSSRRFKSLDDKEDLIERAFLPISSHQLLVGTAFEMVRIDLQTINSAIAKCSQEYFVCSNSCTDIVELAPLIGEAVGFVSQTELEQLVEKSILNLDNNSL